MVSWILRKIVGSKNQREVKRMAPTVRRINEIEETLRNKSDEDLRNMTAAWKNELSKIQSPQEQWQRLEEILPEAFAVVKNAARRLTERQVSFPVCDQPMSWNMVHFDVQLVGGIVLHRGRIAEMATGEGKTLVATLPLYLNALTGRGAHLVTVNDYLARRDAEWMGQLYQFLGLTVGIIQHDQPPDLRRQQYAMDITYGTNSEFGFDYLRDNGMATTREQQVQRGYHFAIVDEVDSILIDEARTPLIISGPATVSTHQYDKWKPLVEQLVRKQTMLVNRIAGEAVELWERSNAESFVPKESANGKVSDSVRKLATEMRVHLSDITGTGKEGQITESDVRYVSSRQDPGLLMFKVKMGQPRNKQLLRMMEDPEKRRAIDKAELQFYQDSRKEELFALKEELFFTIDEKSQEADLSEQGREFMNPDDPNAFVLPDLISEFTDVDLDPDLSQAEKDKKKAERQQHCDAQGERIHNIAQLLRAY
jgi:preprotein translocase subunit SecA